ncbi:pre-mRNA-splicing factor SLU7-like [Liolophura sinensis]|uniref:pre-mRNA-splicing factor SLU7-like n=1 Tax=Liolophura sinensis TaxID=3198878 RepID=UPI0031583EB7
MSFQVNQPPSVVAKVAKSEEVDTGGGKKQSREDWKKMKELEEARKAGTAPAMQDEEGKDINPHIPQYIMQAPWYFGASAPTLRHQRQQAENLKTFTQMGEWYKRGVREGQIATKYRKGACENCGSLTHKKKDCVERPRKVGAKYTGENIAPDEFLQPKLDFDFDGKRDRWNGYDPEQHQKIIEDYAKIEEAKQVLKAQKLEESFTGETDKVEEKQTGKDSDDEDKYAEDADMPGQKFETKQRITVRNLRIREDTAKYLYNLDLNSAYYDPKTRSMRENPFRNSGQPDKELEYAGDNFVRSSGDANNFALRQLFAWEAYERGTDIQLQADPTKTELLYQEVEDRKTTQKTSQKMGILDKYGGQEHLEAPPKELLLSQTEDYVEYSRHGTLLKGQEKPVIRSKYEEDTYINNHTTVWGSYWKDGVWGYKCCYSCVKESYCTGEAGKEAAEAGVLAIMRGSGREEDAGEEEPVKSLVEQHKEKLEKKKKKKKKHKKKHRKSDSDSDSEDEDAKKKKKMKEALRKEVESQRQADELLAIDERKRPYNSMFEAKAPTEEEMEAFRMKRLRTEDPMSHF